MSKTLHTCNPSARQWGRTPRSRLAWATGQVFRLFWSYIVRPYFKNKQKIQPTKQANIKLHNHNNCSLSCIHTEWLPWFSFQASFQLFQYVTVCTQREFEKTIALRIRVSPFPIYRQWKGRWYVVTTLLAKQNKTEQKPVWKDTPYNYCINKHTSILYIQATRMYCNTYHTHTHTAQACYTHKYIWRTHMVHPQHIYSVNIHAHCGHIHASTVYTHHTLHIHSHAV